MMLLVSNIFIPALVFLFQEVVDTNSVVYKAKHPDLSKFLVIGALLFIIGVAGVLTRRNIIVFSCRLN